MKNFLFLICLFIYQNHKELHAQSTFFNIKDYGATGDNTALDSKAINKAIEAAVKAGGGTVYVPAGKYKCGSIRLKSHINLFLAQGSVIIAAPLKAENDYDECEPSINSTYQDIGHSHWKNSLIWGYDIEDVSITGAGLIDGRNLFVNSNKDWDMESTMNANKSISLYRCKNVIIRDVSIIYGGWFAILATGVDNLTLDNLKIDTNRDGIDIDCCKNVKVSNCFVNSRHDDAICLKSTYALGYPRTTENVTITNCQVSGYEIGSLLDGTFKRKKEGEDYPTGRIKLGTESNGGFINIAITNCVFDYCRGLALETVDGAILEDIVISNITMRDICNAPIFMRLGARMRGPEGIAVGKLRRVMISNVNAYNVYPNQAILITGIPQNNIEDIELKNIKIYYRGGGTEEHANRQVPELEKDYPEPDRFGFTNSYGIFIRHVNGVTLEYIDFKYISEEKRPACYVEDVNKASFRFVKAMKNTPANNLVVKQSGPIELIHSLDLPDGIMPQK